MKPNLSKYFWGMGKRGDGNQSTLIIKKKTIKIFIVEKINYSLMAKKIF